MKKLAVLLTFCVCLTMGVPTRAAEAASGDLAAFASYAKLEPAGTYTVRGAVSCEGYRLASSVIPELEQLIGDCDVFVYFQNGAAVTDPTLLYELSKASLAPRLEKLKLFGDLEARRDRYSGFADSAGLGELCGIASAGLAETAALFPSSAPSGGLGLSLANYTNTVKNANVNALNAMAVGVSRTIAQLQWQVFIEYSRLADDARQSLAERPAEPAAMLPALMSMQAYTEAAGKIFDGAYASIGSYPGATMSAKLASYASASLTSYSDGFIGGMNDEVMKSADPSLIMRTTEYAQLMNFASEYCSAKGEEERLAAADSFIKSFPETAARYMPSLVDAVETVAEVLGGSNIVTASRDASAQATALLRSPPSISAVKSASDSSTTYVHQTAVTAAKYRVTADIGLNVRSGPGTGFTVRGVLKFNDVVTVTKIAGGWGYVTNGNDAGWISLEYAKPYVEAEKKATPSASYLNANGYEYAMFPMKALTVSQGVYSNLSHRGVKALDLTGTDHGCDSVYAPFTGVIRGIYGSDHMVYFESLNPVVYADGTVDYMTIVFMHDNDISDLYVGQTIKQGEKFYSEGDAGNAYGNHIHIECGKGKYTGSGGFKNSYGFWCVNDHVMPYDALFLSKDTTVKNDYGYAWITLSDK